MRKLLFFVLIIILAASCNNDTTTISGKYPGDGHGYIYLKNTDISSTSPVDSAKISKTGNFKFKFVNPEPSFYTLGFDNNEFITVVAEPGDKINIDFKGKRLQNDYKVTGSEESDKIRLLDKKLGKTLIRLDSLRNIYDTIAVEEGNEEKAAGVEQLYNSVIEEQRKHNIGFILENLSNLSAIKALYQQLDPNTYVLYRQRDLQYLKLVSDSLGSRYPGIKLTTSLMKNLEIEMNNMYINRLSQAVEGAEEVNLDADLEDINGKRIRLSDVIKGHYVLMSFWSAQSKECISNNIQLKQIYQQYHKKGFEVYHVNLDTDESLWKNSVRFDELPWINVREDDPADPVTARIFNITTVPANYLFDMNGDIIGKNLFGRNLKIKLEQIFD